MQLCGMDWVQRKRNCFLPYGEGAISLPLLLSCLPVLQGYRDWSTARIPAGLAAMGQTQFPLASSASSVLRRVFFLSLPHSLISFSYSPCSTRYDHVPALFVLLFADVTKQKDIDDLLDMTSESRCLTKTLSRPDDPISLTHCHDQSSPEPLRYHVLSFFSSFQNQSQSLCFLCSTSVFQPRQ